MDRAIYTFDTSPIGSGQTVSSVVLSLQGNDKQNSIGSDVLHITSSSPASNNTLVAADFGQLGSTDFGSVTYASFSLTAYNDITLNSSGIANINPTGISKFGARGGWDLNNNFTGTWSSFGHCYYYLYFADQTGTTKDPKLVVTYSAGAPPSGNSNFLMFM
jgi:hypothetical protein